jgi:hypothetical protein
MKFELDQTDVETILAALRDQRIQLQDEIRRRDGDVTFDSNLPELLNEVCVTEEKIRHQQSWGID